MSNTSHVSYDDIGLLSNGGITGKLLNCADRITFKGSFTSTTNSASMDDPPTIFMTFGVNDSPLAGCDGTHLTGGKIGDRLVAEAEINIVINVLPSLSESFEVQGRGELQLDGGSIGLSI